MDDIDIGAAVFGYMLPAAPVCRSISTDLGDCFHLGELKDPIDVTGELHENASAMIPASNETTKKDTSSEDVRILVAFVMSEQLHHLECCQGSGCPGG